MRALDVKPDSSLADIYETISRLLLSPAFYQQFHNPVCASTFFRLQAFSTCINETCQRFGDTVHKCVSINAVPIKTSVAVLWATTNKKSIFALPLVTSKISTRFTGRYVFATALIEYPRAFTIRVNRWRGDHKSPLIGPPSESKVTIVPASSFLRHSTRL